MVIIKAKVARSLWENSKGLLFSKKASPILLETHFGIHTFFLKFPIDVLILDKDHFVKVIRKSIKPNQVFFWNPIYNQILELPDGEIERNQIKLGEQIKIISH